MYCVTYITTSSTVMPPACESVERFPTLHTHGHLVVSDPAWCSFPQVCYLTGKRIHTSKISRQIYQPTANVRTEPILADSKIDTHRHFRYFLHFFSSHFKCLILLVKDLYCCLECLKFTQHCCQRNLHMINESSTS